jgi:uncharacterized membrane protein
MQDIIAVVFENEQKASEGLRALRELDKAGDIVLFEARIISKRPDRSVYLVDSFDHLSLPMVGGGTILGALAGLLAGPFGVVPGAALGAVAGTITDLKTAGVTDEFVDRVKEALKPDTAALVADLEEERFATPVDPRMEEIGGVVVRQMRSIVKQTEEDTEAAARHAELEQLKANRAKLNAGEVREIDARIDHLRLWFEQVIQRRRDRMALSRRNRLAKVQELQRKADQAQAGVERRKDAEVAELQQEYLDKTKAVRS